MSKSPASWRDKSQAIRRAWRFKLTHYRVFNGTGFQTDPLPASRTTQTDPLPALLSACFGGLATLLAAVGLYGVMSYTVARRTREIGLSMALGAARSSVVWLVMRDVTVLAVVRLAAGLPAAIEVSRLVASQLFGVSPTDPLTLVASTVTLLTVALLAG